MREMPRALGCKLGLLQPCGTLIVSYPDDNWHGAFSIGGPYFHLTEKGVEGPFYPTIGVELGLVPAASPEIGVVADKPDGDNGQTGAA